ncbi:MAG: GntG family PLP-dependent aldolase [Polyangiaceae bacterium]
MTIDLRSDTVTRPTANMRRAMADAEVGDDVFGEDPTVLALEEEVAELLGKEAALFVPSGTMGNQIALLVHTSRGDEVYAGAGSHCAWYESGAGAAWSGVQFKEIGKGGLFTAEELEEAIPARAYWCPNPRVVVVENTHNRGGGRVWKLEEIHRVAAVAKKNELAFHLDGARLFNAVSASGLRASELAAPFDTASVCFSKGLGAPVGSAFVSSRANVVRARRFRKMLGGGMRQVGVLAAACRFALAHHRERLAEDHANAARFASLAREEIASLGGAVLEPETNIVMVDLREDAATVARALEARGVRAAVLGPRRLRFVTHLDVSRAGVEAAAAALVDVVREMGRRPA